MGDVDLGDFAGNVIAAFDLLEVLAIGAVDAAVDVIALFAGEEVGVGDADLRHDGDGLRVGAVFFSFDLFVQSAVAADLLRELEEVVGGTDTHFAPAVVVEVAVVNFVVVIEDFDVREHGDDGLAGFEHVHVALHVHLKEFRALHEGDLFHELDVGEGEFGNFVQNGVVNFDIGVGVDAEEGAEFDAGILEGTDVVGQSLLHVDELGDFVKRAVWGDFAIFAHLVDLLIGFFAFSKEFFRNVDGALGGSDLEVDADGIQHKVLRGAAEALVAEKHAVVFLQAVHERKTEVQNAEGEIDVEVVDGLVLAGGVGVVTRALGAMNLFAAGGGDVVTMDIAVTDGQIRQHAEHFAGAHLMGDFFFKAVNLEIDVVFNGEFDAVLQGEDFVRRKISVLGAFEMLDGAFYPFVLVVFIRLASKEGDGDENHQKIHQRLFHVLVLYTLGKMVFLVDDIISRRSNTFNKIYTALNKQSPIRVQGAAFFDLSKDVIMQMAGFASKIGPLMVGMSLHHGCMMDQI